MQKNGMSQTHKIRLALFDACILLFTHKNVFLKSACKSQPKPLKHIQKYIKIMLNLCAKTYKKVKTLNKMNQNESK